MRLGFALTVLLAAVAIPPAAAQHRAQREYRPITGLKVQPGQPMPDFSGPHNLASLRGKPVLISFYTAYCAPCIREIPKLNALSQLNPDLQVLAISADPPNEAAEFGRTRFLRWPIVAPGKDYLFGTLGVKAFPTFALVDAQGHLVSTTYGNQLGQDGNLSLSGIADWVQSSLGLQLR